MKKYLLIFIVILSSSNNMKSQVNNNENVTADLDVPNFLRVYEVPSIGGSQVEVYKNSNNQYFYNPLILIDWEDFSEKLEKIKDTDEKKIITLSIRMHHYYDKVQNELKMMLERDEVKNTNVNLSNLPYTYYILKAKIGQDYLILNPNDMPTFSSSSKKQIIHMIKKDINYAIYGTIKQLRDFYNKRDIDDNVVGSLYSGGFEFASDYIKGSADFSNSLKIKKQLFGDETLDENQIINSTSEDGGFSLSLGPVKLGGGKVQSVVWADNKKKRIVNRNYLSDLISKNSTEIHVLSVVNDPDKARETKNNITNFLLQNVATKVSLEFVKINDKEYNLMNNQITYVTLQNGEVDKLLSSKPKTEYSSKTEQNVTYAGATVANKDDIKNEGSDEITWQYKGSEWMPTKVEMYIITESQVEDSYLIDDMTYVKNGKKTIEIPFIYPSVWLADNQKQIKNNILDRDNPIGTILAFGGDVSKIPVGWRLCDGLSLQILNNVELFNVIGYNWGKLTNGDFKLPDLRGIFLRGVTYDSEKDPDLDNRKENGVGQKNNVGSYQVDAFANHKHQIKRATVGDGGGFLGGNNAEPLAEGKSENSETGGAETRPKNVYVNYIIRVN